MSLDPSSPADKPSLRTEAQTQTSVGLSVFNVDRLKKLRVDMQVSAASLSKRVWHGLISIYIYIAWHGIWHGDCSLLHVYHIGVWILCHVGSMMVLCEGVLGWA